MNEKKPLSSYPSMLSLGHKDGSSPGLRVFLFRNIQSAIDYIYKFARRTGSSTTPRKRPSTSWPVLNNLKSDPLFYHCPVLDVIDEIPSVPFGRTFRRRLPEKGSTSNKRV
jgi:hypothetical protein